MVERIGRISRSAGSAQAEAGNTLNLGSDAQNAWVAARQSKINDDIEERREHQLPSEQGDNTERARGSRQDTPLDDARQAGDLESEELRFSGESERIGTQNFDEDTPFGERVAIL